METESAKPQVREVSMLPYLQRIVHAYAWRLGRFGMPTPMAGILVQTLYRPDEAEPARLASFVQIPRQSMSTMLARLQRRGLLVMESHPLDKRRKRVVLTPEGERLAREMFEDLLDYERLAIDVIHPGKLPEIRRLLDAYVRMLEDLNEKRPPRPSRAPAPKG